MPCTAARPPHNPTSSGPRWLAGQGKAKRLRNRPGARRHTDQGRAGNAKSGRTASYATGRGGLILNVFVLDCAEVDVSTAVEDAENVHDVTTHRESDADTAPESH